MASRIRYSAYTLLLYLLIKVIELCIAALSEVPM